ncbi:DUF4998 domain-containing protein [Niabella beijingensis]|uniref:DUF4998 domain-containing protein n=1 Tax=Niabella beijingensis TaxID=2872700 RepID=UPI001CC01AC4|nr:DUF4998 domain-containing protein [Niabella beijingensis]MBZ4187348.1 DUF4998 domain-containing protein [Niabella beijingensis]
MNKKLLIPFLLLLLIVVSCSKMYDNIEKYAGETVYPGKFDTLIGRVGFERIELDFMKDRSRIPASQMKLGKATKSVFEYDGKTVTVDTLTSWISITGLSESKLYRIKAYTIDDNGNKSIPQEIALIPYTEGEKENLTISPPKITATPDAAALSWPGGLSSFLLDYYGLKYSYKDKTGVLHQGTLNEKSNIVMQGLKSGEINPIDISFKVIPKMNGIPILDTVWLDEKIEVSVPATADPYYGQEQSLGAILTANKENGGGPEGNEGSTKVMDFDPRTKFLIGGYASDFWIQQELFAPSVVNAYLLSTGDDAPGRDPKSWRLEASQNGTQWTVLDTQTNQLFSQRTTAYIYTINNSTAYKFYRLAITENNGNDLFQLGEWRLLLK